MGSNIIWIFVLVKVVIAKSFPFGTESDAGEALTSTSLEADEDKIEAAVQPDYSTTIGSLPPDSMSRAKVI